MKQGNLTEMLKDARRRQGDHYFNGFIHAYCDNQKCTGRRFEIQIKTYGAKDPKVVYCPLCRKEALFDAYKENAVETLDEYSAREDKAARSNVNRQLYQKRTGDSFIPASIFLDDSLPE